MKILLIGATGQIGYTLTNALSRTAHDPSVLVRNSRIPVIVHGSFPVVHADSLAAAILGALDKPGAFLVSDQMTSLKEIARTLREQAQCYVPPTVPPGLAYASAALLEFFARRLKGKPIIGKEGYEIPDLGF